MQASSEDRVYAMHCSGRALAVSQHAASMSCHDMIEHLNGRGVKENGSRELLFSESFFHSPSEVKFHVETSTPDQRMRMPPARGDQSS